MFYIFLFFIKHFIDTISSQKHSCSFLIKTLNNLLIVTCPFFPDSCHSCNQLTFSISKNNFDLEVIILNIKRYVPALWLRLLWSHILLSLFWIDRLNRGTSCKCFPCRLICQKRKVLSCWERSTAPKYHLSMPILSSRQTSLLRCRRSPDSTHLLCWHSRISK